MMKLAKIPRERALADSKAGHGSRSQSNISTPVRYNPTLRGHSRAALSMPIREKNNATCPYVASPMTFLNRTLYTAEPAAAEAASTTPPSVGLPVIPSM